MFSQLFCNKKPGLLSIWFFNSTLQASSICSGKFKTFKSKQWTDQKGFPCYNFWDIDAEHPRTAVNYSVRKV